MPDSQERYRGALIGCGYFGQIQLESWKRMPGVSIVAACDVVVEKARTFADRAYGTLEQLLDSEQVDFLDIATRPATHLPLIRTALEHGIPVICQKPMAPTLEDAIEIAVLSESAEIPVMIHENWRWQPWYREAHRRIAAGDIGVPVSYHFRHRQRDGLGPNPYPNQPYFREMPRLLIYETLVHYLDTARFLFGDIEGVYARTRRKNPLIAGEDGALLTIDHSYGTTGVIDGNRYLNPERPGPAMGEALLEGDENWMRIIANGDIHLNGDLVWQSPTVEGYKGDSVRATQQHFIDCLRAGAAFETSANEYVHTYAAVEAAYRSVETGKRIALREVAARAGDSASG